MSKVPNIIICILLLLLPLLTTTACDRVGDKCRPRSQLESDWPKYMELWRQLDKLGKIGPHSKHQSREELLVDIAAIIYVLVQEPARRASKRSGAARK